MKISFEYLYINLHTNKYKSVNSNKKWPKIGLRQHTSGKQVKTCSTFLP